MPFQKTPILHTTRPLVVALSEQAGACRVLFSPCWDFERGRGYRWGSGEESLRNWVGTGKGLKDFLVQIIPISAGAFLRIWLCGSKPEELLLSLQKLFYRGVSTSSAVLPSEQPPARTPFFCSIRWRRQLRPLIRRKSIWKIFRKNLENIWKILRKYLENI